MQEITINDGTAKLQKDSETIWLILPTGMINLRAIESSTTRRILINWAGKYFEEEEKP